MLRSFRTKILHRKFLYFGSGKAIAENTTIQNYKLKEDQKIKMFFKII